MPMAEASSAAETSSSFSRLFASPACACGHGCSEISCRNISAASLNFPDLMSACADFSGAAWLEGWEERGFASAGAGGVWLMAHPANSAICKDSRNTLTAQERMQRRLYAFPGVRDVDYSCACLRLYGSRLTNPSR